jgi:hypothetical protein
VAQQFNPYHAWLEFEAGKNNPSYPELLNLAADESDDATINMAFDRVIAQVRSCKPGPHAAEWARLIDELKAAKFASEKMGFAQVVASQTITAPTAMPPETAPPAEVDPVLAALGLDDSGPDFTTPDEENEEESPPPNSVPNAAVQPQYVGPQQPVSTAVPQLASPSAAVPAPVLGGQPAPPSRSNMSGVIIGLVSCALTIGLLGGAYYVWFGPPEADQQTDTSVASSSPVQRAAPTTNTNTNPTSGTGDDNATEPKQPLEDSDPPEKMDPVNPPPTTDTDPPETDKPEVMAPQPPPRGKEPEPKELTAEQLKQLAEQLKNAKTLLGEGKIEEANGVLTAALPTAGTTSQRAMIERLQLLAGYVSAFSKAVDAGLGKLKPGDSIPLGDAIVALVEKKPDSVVIHILGRNREYPLAKLPLGLAHALADQSLDQAEASTLVIKGAYQAVHPRTSPEHVLEIRDWWRDASDKGETIADLILVLDDDYDRMAGLE